MTTPIVRKLRCAIYTSKSSVEGLEQEFNSLHAQREACEAHTASQRSEGWVLVRDQYYDGGISCADPGHCYAARAIPCCEARWTDSALVKALAHAFRRKRMLKSGEFATIAELAECEGIAPPYMTRVVRLTLLAPHIVEPILEVRQGTEVTLARMLKPFPAPWALQSCSFS